MGGTGLVSDVGYIDKLVEFISGKGQAVGGLLAADLENAVHGGRERVEGEMKVIHRGVGKFGRERVTLLGSLQKLYVGGQGISGDVFHTLVKVDMAINLDATGFWAVPKNVVGGGGEEAKEDAFLGVGMEFGSAMTRRTDPNTAAKGAETSEVVLFTSGKFKRDLPV